MSIMDLLFGRKPAKTRGAQNSRPDSQPASQISSVQSQMSPHAVASQNSTRRELLRVVLRDTLTRHGIPTAWISADMLVATSRAREPGIHWRLSVRHWDERLMVHSVALQNNLIRRVLSFDPLATSWLMGISWQMALEDESNCPPMPHPGIWTQAPQRALAAAAAAPAPGEIAGGSGDVIAGPVVIGGSSASDDSRSAREDLEKLFAVRDADIANHARQHPATFAPTEPAKL
jgi:hypothetical protein